MKTDPYEVHGGVLGTPDPCLLNISGGRTSGMMLRKVLDAYGGVLPEGVRACFTNTGREMVETLDFVKEMSGRWSVPIAWIERDPDAEGGYREVGRNSASRDGEPFERLIRDKQYLPNRVARFCTVELKIKPAEAWCRSQGWTKWASVLGYRADEVRRLLSAQKRGYALAPMVDAGVTKRDVVSFWAAQPFDLLLPTVGGKTPMGNCDGCFLKGEKVLAGIARSHPERFAWWPKMEVETGKTFRGSDRMSHTQIAALVRDQGDMLAGLSDEAEGIDCYCTGE